MPNRELRYWLAVVIAIAAGARSPFDRFQFCARGPRRARIVASERAHAVAVGLAGLLYVNTRSWVETAIGLAAVPFSLLGAVASAAVSGKRAEFSASP